MLLALWLEIKNRSHCKELNTLVQKYQMTGDKNHVIHLLACVEKGGKGKVLSSMIASFIGRQYPDYEELREDFLHDFFMKMCEKLQKISIQTSVRNYIRRAVKNECINFKKRLDKDKNRKIELDQIDKEKSDSLKSNLDVEQLLTQMKNSLINEEWEAVWKVYYEGKSYEIASEEMKISRNAFRGIIYRAVQKLRDKFGDSFWQNLL